MGIQLLGEIMTNKNVVKIMNSMSEGFFSTLRKFNIFNIKTRNIFDVKSAVMIKEGDLFDTPSKRVQQSLKDYEKTDVFELSTHLSNSLSKKEKNMHKDFMKLYSDAAITSNSWDFKKAKFDFKKKYNIEPSKKEEEKFVYLK